MKFRPIVIANWKMNPSSLKEAKASAAPIARLAGKLKRASVVIAPTFVHLSAIKPGKRLFLGGQNVSSEKSGAHTGEVSAEMLKDMGVSYVIVGHSERRAIGESDTMVNKKVKAALSNGITPIVCIGESEHDSQGKYLAFLTDQVRLSLADISKADLLKSIIAYEPLWAIGKDAQSAMTSGDLHETVLFIQKILSEMYGRAVSRSVPIIYGGSVKEENVVELIQNGNVKGFLVGGASLSAATFGPILQAVDSQKDL